MRIADIIEAIKFNRVRVIDHADEEAAEDDRGAAVARLPASQQRRTI